MTTVDRDLARHVADNPDGCVEDDLKALVDYIGEGDRPAPQAASLWPNGEVEKIDGYETGDRIDVAVKLRDYCRRSLKARALRSTGSVQRALNLEAVNETLYKSLPEWARW